MLRRVLQCSIQRVTHMTRTRRLITTASDEIDSNLVRFGGLVKRGYENNSFTLADKYDYEVKVEPSGGLKEKFEEIKVDMNVYVEGSLCQRFTIEEEDGKYKKKRKDFIKANKLEIFNTDEEVERKYEEMRESD